MSIINVPVYPRCNDCLYLAKHNENYYCNRMPHTEHITEEECEFWWCGEWRDAETLEDFHARIARIKRAEKWNERERDKE